MSFLIGPVSGALVAGGVYYGFSNMIQTRTASLKSDLHTLSGQLIGAETYIPAPTPAAARVAHHPFASQLKSEWNGHIEAFFHGFSDLDRRAADWGRQLLYGGDASRRESR